MTADDQRQPHAHDYVTPEPSIVPKATVQQIFSLLGLPFDDLRSVTTTPTWVTARFLLRDPSKQLKHGVTELVLEMPIGG